MYMYYNCMTHDGYSVFPCLFQYLGNIFIDAFFILPMKFKRKAREVNIGHGPFQKQILKSLSFENFAIAEDSKMKSKICIVVVFLVQKNGWYLRDRKKFSAILVVCCCFQV